jgi:subfamily B ATP-binding cassette protein MsbA
MPDLMALVRPRRGILITGMTLIALTRVAALAPPLAMKSLIDDVIGGGNGARLPLIIFAVTGAAVFQQIISYTLTQIFSRSTTRLIGELRCKLQTHVMRLSLLYHDTHKSGVVGSHIMNDVQGLQNLVGQGLLNYVGSLMTSIIALSVMATYSPVLTGIAVVSLVGVAVIIARGTARVREIAHTRTRLFADVVGRLTEALGGVRVVKAYRAEDREDAVFATGIARVVENQLRSVDLSSRLNLSTGLLWGCVNAVVIWVGAHKILAHELTLGKFFAFNFLLQMATAPVLSIVGIGTMLMEALAGLERTREIFREPREDQDPRRTVSIGSLKGEIAFEAVEFAYAEDKPVLRDFSFRAAPGTVTALVGPSGSGKSTTIGLIASFYKPTQGVVTIDGVDLTTVKIEAYRSQLGVVLQETFLFAGTILENVAFARPDATREQILAACRTARVDEFTEKFADKYETVVGERGVMLSGGQRQRISIARALLADPRVLILDEATSSLDTHSEALIQEALSHLLEGRTTFVIAHRLSTIRKADQILVVDAGRIIERGTHDELLAARGLYQDMYAKQHHLQEDLFLAPGEGADVEAARKPQLTAGPGDEPVAVLIPS